MEFDFSSLLQEYTLVFLQTTDSCLIGEIRKVVPADSLLLILDTFNANKLFLFDRNGRFIRQIGSYGQGPGEYIQATDCYYDHSKNQIVLFDQFKSAFFYYDMTGNYLGWKKFLFRFLYFTKAGDRFVYKHLDNEGELADYSLSIGSDSSQVDEVCLPHLKFHYAMGALQQVNDSTVAYGIPFCDTIYHYDAKYLYPAYHLKFNPRTRLPEDFGEKADYNYRKFREIYPAKRYTYFDGEFVETDRYLFFYIYYSQKRWDFYYSKITGELHGGINQTFGKYDSFENILLSKSPVSNDGDNFISVLEASNLYVRFKFMKEDVKQSLTLKHPQLVTMLEDDNPVLCIYKLK